MSTEAPSDPPGPPRAPPGPRSGPLPPVGPAYGIPPTMSEPPPPPVVPKGFDLQKPEEWMEVPATHYGMPALPPDFDDSGRRPLWLGVLLLSGLLALTGAAIVVWMLTR